MLPKRKVGLERATNWGIAIAVPLVAIGGFKLLAHARDGAQPVPGLAAPPATTGRVLAPPIDASAPPVVTLRPAAAAASPAVAEPRCATPGQAPAHTSIGTAAGAERGRADCTPQPDTRPR